MGVWVNDIVPEEAARRLRAVLAETVLAETVLAETVLAETVLAETAADATDEEMGAAT